MKGPKQPPAGDPPAESPGRCPVDDRELARFLKPQPPLVVPERSKPAFEPGYLAHTLLGNRVYKGDPVIRVSPREGIVGKTVIVWWFPDWQGVSWFRWQEPLGKTYRWSLVLGFLELRRLV